MRSRGKASLKDRVAEAARAALAAQQFVSPIDVLMGIGWIDLGTVQRWRQGQIECLDQAIQTRPALVVEPEALAAAQRTIEEERRGR